MKLSKIWGALCFLSLFVCLGNLSAADNSHLLAETTETEFFISYDIEPRSKPPLDFIFGAFSAIKFNEMTLWVNLPQTIPGKQEIINISFDPEPSRHFRQNGNYYVEYKFDLPDETVHIEIRCKAKIFQCDLATMMESGTATGLPDPNLGKYLLHERMLEKDDPLIQELASKISGKDELETVREIYNFIAAYLTIDLMKIKGVGAAKTAESKKGMCIDYCDLFVALCRAKGIPARVVAGFSCRFSASPKHSWTEVYVEPYGWIPLDPTTIPNWTDAQRDHRFYHRMPHFLRFTHIRNDKVLHYNYFYCFPSCPMIIERLDNSAIRSKTKYDRSNLQPSRVFSTAIDDFGPVHEVFVPANKSYSYTS